MSLHPKTCPAAAAMLASWFYQLSLPQRWQSVVSMLWLQCETWVSAVLAGELLCLECFSKCLKWLETKRSHFFFWNGMHYFGNGMQRMLWCLQNMRGFYSSKIPVNRWNLVRHLATKFQQKLHTLWVHNKIRDHRLLSEQLRNALLWILHWNKRPSGSNDNNHLSFALVIMTSFLQAFYPTEESLHRVSYLYII